MKVWLGMGEEVFVRRASGLVRELSWFDVTIWAIACPAASGMTYYAVRFHLQSKVPPYADS
jgi:hypothetical protein